MSEIVEIVEESKNQLDIIETGVGQIEVVGDNKNTIEVLESSLIYPQLRGTVTSSNNSISVTGSNTFFLQDLAVGDTVQITSGSLSQLFKVATITNDTLLTLEGVWTGNTYTGSFISKQIVGGSVDSGDVITNIETNIVAIESPSDSTEISVTDIFTQVEVSSTDVSVEITEKSLLSGSFDLTFPNLLNNPFKHPVGSSRIGTVGVENPIFNLQISGSVFADTVTSSKNIIQGDGTDDLLLIKLGNDANPKIKINPQGIAILDNYNYTPTPHEGGLLFSGSEFYLGLK